MKLFVKKKNLAWNSTFFVPKLFHKLLPFFCCFLAKTEENTTVLFWKCSSKQTSRCTLLSTIEVSPEKKNCCFIFQTKLFYQKPKKKTTKFCLFVQDATNYRTRWSRKKKIKPATFKLEKASSWATMRRKESVEQNKNRRKNLMTHLTSDIEASGESSFWWPRIKFYDLDEIVPQGYMKQKKKKRWKLFQRQLLEVQVRLIKTIAETIRKLFLFMLLPFRAAAVEITSIFSSFSVSYIFEEQFHPSRKTLSLLTKMKILQKLLY